MPPESPAPESAPPPPHEGQPAPSSPETPPHTPPGQETEAGRPSLDTKVPMPDGSTIPLYELVQRAQAADNLAAYKEAASVLLRGEGDAATREASIRHVMTEEGYTPDQIEEYVMQIRGEQQGTPDNPTRSGEGHGSAEGQEAPTPSGVFGENDRDAAAAEELRKRLDDIEGRQAQANVQQMRAQLEQEVARTLDGHHGLRILLEKSQDLNGEGDEARKYIAEELERQTMDFLRVRKARGESFNSGWFAEESQKAAEAVFKKYRSVIGDPDKLQRAPETESGHESLLRKPPLPPPSYERGDGRAGADQKAHDYTVDVLSRLAMGLEGGGDSKV